MAKAPAEQPRRPRTRIVSPMPQRGPRADGAQPAGTSTAKPTDHTAGPDRRATSAAERASGGADRLMLWVVLAGILALAMPALLIDLRRPAVQMEREARAVETAVQTWQRQSEAAELRWFEDRIMPIADDRAVLDQPPGAVWLHLLAMQGLEPADATPRRLAYRARLVSAIAALIAIAGVFWAGYAIGGLNPAALAALTLAGCPVFIFYGRMATPDMPAIALSVVAAAAAIWAMRPHRRPPSRGRQALGYATFGLALGGVGLIGGAAAALPVAAPIILLGILAPRRAQHMTGLAAGLGLALLLAAPWAVIVHEHDPHAWRGWAAALVPAAIFDGGSHVQVTTRRIGLILLGVLPWTLWLLLAIAQPFSTSSAGWRSRMFLGWAWFVTVFAMIVVAPGEGTLNELLLVLPAAAVLIGQLFRRLIDLSSEGRHARVWRFGRWPTISLLLLLSVLVPTTLAMQQTLIDKQWLVGKIAFPMHWGYHAASAVILLGIAVYSVRLAARHYPGKALVCWAIWSIVLVTAVAMPISRGPLMQPADTNNAPLHQILPLGQQNPPLAGGSDTA